MLFSPSNPHFLLRGSRLTEEYVFLKLLFIPLEPTPKLTKNKILLRTQQMDIWKPILGLVYFSPPSICLETEFLTHKDKYLFHENRGLRGNQDIFSKEKVIEHPNRSWWLTSNWTQYFKIILVLCVRHLDLFWLSDLSWRWQFSTTQKDFNIWLGRLF